MDFRPNELLSNLQLSVAICAKASRIMTKLRASLLANHSASF